MAEFNQKTIEEMYRELARTTSSPERRAQYLRQAEKEHGSEERFEKERAAADRKFRADMRKIDADFKRQMARIRRNAAKPLSLPKLPRRRPSRAHYILPLGIKIPVALFE